MSEKEILSQTHDLSKNYSLYRGEVYCSNDLNFLMQSFACKFKKKLVDGLLRQIIVIPSNLIKSRLTQYLKTNLGISFGLRFLTLPQAVEHLMKLYAPSLSFPSHLELMLFLDGELKQLVHQTPEAYPELSQYMKKDEKIRHMLAEELSHSFLSYGLYGGEALKEWMQIRGWQQALFQKASEHWEFPYTFSSHLDPRKLKVHFHLFAPLHIPKIYRDLFDQIDLSIYYRSATPHFLGDLLSDRSLYFFEERFKRAAISPEERFAFQDLGKETNRFVANLAKMPLPMASWIQEKTASEEYFLPQARNTLLSEHQRAFFDLETRQIFKKEGDDSIEIYAAPSRIREIEVIYDRLIRLFDSEKIGQVGEIQIFAPDIEKYAAAIELVFGRDDSPFGYIISDIPDKSPKSSLAMIASFFRQASSRFNIKELFELFLSPCCLPNLPINEQELTYFWRVFESFHISWGYDREMRSEILGHEAVSSQGTFKEGFDKLIERLCYLESPIELSQSEAFGKLIGHIDKMANVMRDLKHRPRKILEWIETVFQLTLEWFVECETRDHFLKEIAKLSSLAPFCSELIDFTLFSKVIEELTSTQEGDLIKTDKPPICFSSIGEGTILQPKVTILLGMDETAFPRSEKRKSLDELSSQVKSDHKPSSSEKDKLFFFEALAYTRERLIISYTTIDESDGKPLLATLLLEELVSMSPGLGIQSHPPFPFSRQNLEHEWVTPYVHRLATARYNPSKTLHIVTKGEIHLPEVIDLAHLSKLATHPIRFYLQEKCGIYLDDDKAEEDKEMQEFMLSYRTRAEIQKSAYLEPKEKILKHLQERGSLPTSLFSIAAKQEIEAEIDQAKETLSHFALSEEDFFQILLDPAIDSPTKKHERLFLHPPIQIGQTLLVGKLPFVTKKGLFSLGDCSLASLWKSWPALLTTGLLAEWKIESSLFFGKDREKRQIAIDDPTASLETFISYYAHALLYPSPLMPDIIRSYGKKEKLLLNQGLFKDRYLEKLSPDLEIDWSPFIEEVRKYEAL